MGKAVVLLIVGVFSSGCGRHDGVRDAGWTLAPPTNVRAASASSALVLTWTAAPDATSYNLYLATQRGVTRDGFASLSGGSRIANVASPDMVTGLINGVTYYLVVTSVNSADESAESEEVSWIPSSSPPPPP
jgi:hypothetical protein